MSLRHCISFKFIPFPFDKPATLRLRCTIINSGNMESASEKTLFEAEIQRSIESKRFSASTHSIPQRDVQVIVIRIH